MRGWLKTFVLIAAPLLLVELFHWMLAQKGFLGIGDAMIATLGLAHSDFEGTPARVFHSPWYGLTRLTSLLIAWSDPARDALYSTMIPFFKLVSLMFVLLSAALVTFAVRASRVVVSVPVLLLLSLSLIAQPALFNYGGNLTGFYPVGLLGAFCLVVFFMGVKGRAGAISVALASFVLGLLLGTNFASLVLVCWMIAAIVYAPVPLGKSWIRDICFLILAGFLAWRWNSSVRVMLSEIQTQLQDGALVASLLKASRIATWTLCGAHVICRLFYISGLPRIQNLTLAVSAMLGGLWLATGPVYYRYWGESLRMALAGKGGARATDGTHWSSLVQTAQGTPWFWAVLVSLFAWAVSLIGSKNHRAWCAFGLSVLTLALALGSMHEIDSVNRPWPFAQFHTNRYLWPLVAVPFFAFFDLGVTRFRTLVMTLLVAGFLINAWGLARFNTAPERPALEALRGLGHSMHLEKSIADWSERHPSGIVHCLIEAPTRCADLAVLYSYRGKKPVEVRTATTVFHTEAKIRPELFSRTGLLILQGSPALPKVSDCEYKPIELDPRAQNLTDDLLLIEVHCPLRPL